jgi:hypothetical protein
MGAVFQIEDAQGRGSADSLGHAGVAPAPDERTLIRDPRVLNCR